MNPKLQAMADQLEADLRRADTRGLEVTINTDIVTCYCVLLAALKHVSDPAVRRNIPHHAVCRVEAVVAETIRDLGRKGYHDIAASLEYTLRGVEP